MNITLEELQKQKENLLRQYDVARSTMDQLKGAMDLVDHFIKQVTTEPEEPAESET